ncbi:hypothetical protein MUK42_09078 [Musa troglodytarum]|uniref:Uncharacterized protein n=1 Tax=Musa troglodytarum TaxID=320322 RepID=A0A9E7JYA2_9LILI|nr:hypothetical protein MUK42_09078 [Musa troglodytarum]
MYLDKVKHKMASKWAHRRRASHYDGDSTSVKLQELFITDVDIWLAIRLLSVLAVYSSITSLPDCYYTGDCKLVTYNSGRADQCSAVAEGDPKSGRWRRAVCGRSPPQPSQRGNQTTVSAWKQRWSNTLSRIRRSGRWLSSGEPKGETAEGMCRRGEENEHFVGAGQQRRVKGRPGRGERERTTRACGRPLHRRIAAVPIQEV